MKTLNIIRYFLALCLVLMLSMPLQAQQMTKLAGKQASTLIAQIDKAARSIKSLQCDFTQVSDVAYLDEKATSTGKMSYRSNGSLTWQYLSPFKYTFSVADGKAVMQSGKRTNTIDLKGNAQFQNIAKMVQGSVTGANLRNNQDFQVVMYANASQAMAYLVPKRAPIRNFLKSVKLYFSKSQKMVQKVEMTQANGDHITITFAHVKVVR